jgi:CotH kinase protein/Secretion system C-terminal sorting domain
MRFLLFICLLHTHVFFCQAQLLTSSNLPIVLINTNGQAIPDNPKIQASMGIVSNAVGVINNVTDSFNAYNGNVGIEVRGQSSQSFPMKSYSIELWNNANVTIKKPLLGMPNESDWVLYAPYTDKTLMHNFLAYTLSRKMGHWAARCRYVELMLNNEYKGIYVLMEKIKKDDSRVNITKLLTTDVQGAAVTGGYIFSIDKQANGWFSSYPTSVGSSNFTQFSYVYPKESNIVQAQKNYIKSYIDSFENALQATNFQDKNLGWRRFADEQSFIDFLLINEVSRNVDGYRLSSYFNKDRNGKIVAGPVWDFDLAFRNANYCNGSNVEGWSWQFNGVCPNDFFQVPFWWQKFNADTAFNANTLCRWKALRSNILSQQNIFNLIDSVATLTTEARQRHFAQWPILGQYVWPNPQPIANTYQGEISTIKTWVAARLIWMDNNLISTGGCAAVPPINVDDLIIKSYPNPMPSNAVINIQSPVVQNIQMQVFDMAGKKIYQQQVALIIGSTNVAINTSTWAKGIYQFSFIADNGKKINKRLLK